MKTIVALLALVAVTTAESFYPLGAGHRSFLPYQGFGGPAFGHPLLGHRPFIRPYNAWNRPILGGGRLFKREADSDSESFYPIQPYHAGNWMGYNGFNNLYNPMMTPYYNPVIRPYTTSSVATHPFMYNPLLKVQEDQTAIQGVRLAKREADSDSFYPLMGYNQNPMIYNQQPLVYGQQQPLAYSQQQPLVYSQQQPLVYSQQQPLFYNQQQPLVYGQQQSNLMYNQMPVLPYSFPAYNYLTSTKVIKPVGQKEQ